MEFTSTGTEYVDSFFAHHGIKGQKWGIRRYQNEDGTLTELGKKRYNKITEKYKNDKGEFSARKSTKASAATALGGAATGFGLTLAGLPMVGLPVAAASGVAASIGAIKRERARRFLENTGTGDVKDISLDRRYATNFDFLGLGAIINTAYGTHREKVAERVKNELANTKMSEIKKSKEEPKKEASTVEKKEPSKKKEKTNSKTDKAEEAFKTFKQNKEYTSNPEIKKIEQLFKTAKTKEDLNKLYDSEKMEQLKEKAADVGGLSFDDVYKFVVPQLYKEREKELAHSGILGMKWGKRRFQNPDGSLTAEGRIRYLKGGDKAIRKAEKQRERRQAILSDRKKLYKHRGEFSKAEIDKAMEKFAAEDQLKGQMNAEKAAKQQAKMDAQKARAALVQSKADYKKMKMQLKLNKQAEDLKRKTQQMQAEEQKKQAKLKTESDKLALESKQETADISAKAEKWKQRANKARSVYDFAKVGQEILSDMGITSKNGNESLFGALAESIGLKDNSAIKAAEARKKAIAKETEDLNLESLRLKVMGERRTFDNNYEEDRKKRAREGIEEAERQAKKAYQDKIDDAKLRQELAKAAKAEYDAANPNKGGKGGGASLDDIEDLLRKYDLI